MKKKEAPKEVSLTNGKVDPHKNTFGIQTLGGGERHNSRNLSNTEKRGRWVKNAGSDFPFTLTEGKRGKIRVDLRRKRQVTTGEKSEPTNLESAWLLC